MTSMLRAAALYPEAVFLDLGANLGVFSLAVAALREKEGHTEAGRVVAVDAMADNLAFIHHSVSNNGFPEGMVTLVHNAIRWASISK